MSDPDRRCSKCGANLQIVTHDGGFDMPHYACGSTHNWQSRPCLEAEFKILKAALTAELTAARAREERLTKAYRHLRNCIESGDQRGRPMDLIHKRDWDRMLQLESAALCPVQTEGNKDA